MGGWRRRKISEIIDMSITGDFAEIIHRGVKINVDVRFG